MSPNRTIDIYEIEPTTSRPEGERSCFVRVVVDGILERDVLRIQDPFGEDDKNLYDWYLEQYPLPLSQATTPDEVYLHDNEEHEMTSRADSVREKLENYGKQLHKSLMIQALPFIDTKHLHINIWEAQNHPERRQQFGIHQILWENLEQPHLWRSTSIVSSRLHVTVRRIVLAPPSTGLPWESRGFTRESPLRVLLVIARNLKKTATNKYEDVKPHIAQIHLLSVQEDLVPLWTSHQVELHIARPGSYNALEERLTAEKKGYFDLVHFDLHGDTIDDPKNSYLLFANDKIDKTSLERHRAEEVADLLARTGVKCVATNACRTAVSYDRREANMCQMFIDKGVSHVSGMSHKICTDAVDLFYWGFYSALIAKGLKFAEAASLGRKKLRGDRCRKCVDSKQLVDWCVPVTYMCPDGQVCGRDYSPFWTTTTHQIFRSLRLWVQQFYNRLSLGKLAAVFSGLASSRRVSNGITRRSHCSAAFSREELLYGPVDPASRVPKAALPKLDINILDFEKRLIHHGAVYFYGPNHNQTVDTMVRLGLLWCRTNFVERVVHIRARQYIEDQPVEYIVQWDTNDPLKSGSSQPINFDFLKLSSPNKKIALVIEGIHELYPDDEDMRATEERRKIHNARKKLANFLTMGIESKIKEKNRYVVITGEKDAEWWESCEELEIWGEPFWRGDPLLEHVRG
ncbi:hypothetical protein F4803DRAFT_545198 [Xylaria telfairii]|nr:hypothetical protein F4803DRAFT_545198 [Xylaria telfairii]